MTKYSYSTHMLQVINNKTRLYKRALKREISVWRLNNIAADLDSVEFLATNFSYSGRNITISKNRDWLEFISLFGSFDKGLILGGGNANFETYLLNKGTVKSFENLDIVFKQSDKKLNLFADLNFAALEENTYDIIIAKSILHHIINLEHLLTQVNIALKPNGIFVVLEYIGESKQQWRDDKMAYINKILKTYNLEIDKGVYDNSVPFESIRSEEIPGIIDQVFKGSKIVEHKWDFFYTSAKLGLYHYRLRNGISQQNIVGNSIEDILMDFEDGAAANNLLPTIMLGVYKKNDNCFILGLKKWDSNKTKKELELNFKNLPYNFKKRIKIIVRDYYNYFLS